MQKTVKERLFASIGIIILAMVFIASSLSHLSLKPGLPLPSLEGASLVAQPTDTIPTIQLSTNAFFRVLLAVLFATLVLITTYRLIKGYRHNIIQWKKILSFSLSAGLFILGMIGILAIIVSLLPTTQEAPRGLQLPTPQIEETVPLGAPPPELKWLVAIAVIILSTLGIMWIVNLRNHANSNRNTIELEVEKARQNLLAGADLNDVILGCYQQMSLALQKEENIERDTFMTTTEFEALLIGRGFPRDPIHQLTQLFEYVRYGHWQPNQIDKQKALDCLTTILMHSRENRKPRK